MKRWFLSLVVVFFGFSAQAGWATESFISEWKVEEADLQVVLPIPKGHSYDFYVDWGDGTRSHVDAYDDPDAAHVYEHVGRYTIAISGKVEAWSFWKRPHSKDKIFSVSNLGNVGWQYLFGAFLNCLNLTILKGGNTSQVTDMRYMFHLASKATPDTSSWDTSQVVSMTGMFWKADVANPNVSEWDTSNVTDMSYMFAEATSANPNVSEWNTSQVTSMRSMFYRARAAAPDMSGWDFANVTTMHRMFWGVTLPTELYSDMLVAIAKTSQQERVILHGGYSKYNADAVDARKELVGRKWLVIDGGKERG